jgi:hypothetical protein
MQYQTIFVAGAPMKGAVRHAVQGMVDARANFDASVQKAIDEGWRPQGGVSIATDNAVSGHLMLAQAMVKD